MHGRGVGLPRPTTACEGADDVCQVQAMQCGLAVWAWLHLAYIVRAWVSIPEGLQCGKGGGWG